MTPSARINFIYKILTIDWRRRGSKPRVRRLQQFRLKQIQNLVKNWNKGIQLKEGVCPRHQIEEKIDIKA